jgi:hypothetical protein
MSVEDPVTDGMAKFECYLDDLFGVFRARDREKAGSVLPLIWHLVGRPVDDKTPESFPQDDGFEVPRRGKGFGDEDYPWLAGKSTHGRLRFPFQRTRGAPGRTNCEGWRNCPVEGPMRMS